MILVCGTKRSGTSMWMGALEAAGLAVVGSRFPRNWDRTALREANSEGFWESTLRDGISWHTNPNPETGEYMHPSEVQHHVVKVFLPGLTRTDLAYLDRVVVTVRDWRSYAMSVARLHALERRVAGDETAEAAVVPTFAHALEWWLENFLGLRDILLRGYPAHVLSYEALVQEPTKNLADTLEWLDAGPLDAAAAVATIDPSLQTAELAPTPADMPPEHVEAFDLLYQRIHRGQDFDEAFLERLNTTHAALAPLLHEHLRHATASRAQTP